MRVPFPISLNVGTDIILHSRIARFSQSEPSKLTRFTTRLLQPLEVVELNRRFPDWESSNSQSTAQQNRATTWLAGRWAAKEAAKKAWGASILSFRDLRVEVCPDDSGVQIVCALQGLIPTDAIEQTAKLSISHDGDYAVAVVIAAPLHPDIKTELGRRRTEAESKLLV